MIAFTGPSDRILKPLGAIIKPVAKSKTLYNLTEKMSEDGNFYSNMALLIIVGKKLVASIFATRASLKNKEVPEEQRKFLAYQEIVNSALVIGLTLTLGRFLGTKGKDFVLKTERVGKWVKSLKPEVAEDVKKGIDMLFTLGSAIFTYRVLVPFLSMPLTKALKEQICPEMKEADSYQTIYAASQTDREAQGSTILMNQVSLWQDEIYCEKRLNVLA